MKTKAIIFDIDGTVIDSPGQKVSSERMNQALRSTEDEYYMSAATGRVWTFAEPVLKSLGLEDPCIISAGTQICNPQTGEIIWETTIDTLALQAVIDIIQQYPDFKILYNDNDENTYLHGGINPLELSITEPVYFFEQIFVPKEIAPEIVAKLSEIEGIAVTLVVAQREGFNDIHVTNRNATKEHAVAELLGIIGVDKANTIGIGDGHNDIHLFNAVGKKVAMGNAVIELKQIADEVIGSVKDDGLATFLEQLDSDTKVSI